METGRNNNVPKDSQPKVYSQPDKPDPEDFSSGFFVYIKNVFYICNPKNNIMMKKPIYTVSDLDRMFVYAWYEKTNPKETKFGEHWVKGGVDPNQDSATYIRNSMNRRKDLFDDGTVVIEMIWDVTEYAKKYDKFYQKSKVDDLIRKGIGQVKQSDVHNMTAEILVERVNDILRKENQPRPEVKLSTAQFDDAVSVLKGIKEGKRRILAELAARYGKTIWSSAVAVESGIPVVVVASYVLTSFTSFKNDIRKYQQFQEIEIVDSQVKGYEEKVTKFVEEGKQVMVFVSLCNGSGRDERVKFLGGFEVQKMVFVDEADYGAHRKGQFDALQTMVNDDDVLILMTGTNSDRASSEWDIDLPLSTTYFELLVNKKESMSLVD